MEKMTERLNSIDNEMTSVFSLMLINGEDALIEAIKKQYPQMVDHFSMLSRASAHVSDLLENDNVYRNFLVALPASMAVDPTIGFQLVKDVLHDIGFESREQFAQWSEANPTKFLNYLRSSVTCIQAYFDLEMEPDNNEENTVVDFIFRVLAGEATQDEQIALADANETVNAYLWT